MRKVLFVCSANLDRSPTAEYLFENWNGRWKAKSAGIIPALARNPLTQALLDWADLILVMEPHHAEFIYAHFKCNPNKVRVLHVSDIYVRDDPELIEELECKVAPILRIEDELREIEEKSRKRMYRLSALVRLIYRRFLAVRAFFFFGVLSIL